MTTVATELERYMLGLINADRAAAGLAPLRLELNLNSSADAHSAWMVAADTFSHTGAGGSSPTDRMIAADMDFSGSWRSAENVGAASVSGASNLYDEVDRVHTGLMNSPGHYANLMDPDMTVIGIGIAVGPLTYEGQGTYQSVVVTQNFARTGGLVDLDLSGGGGSDSLAGAGGDDHIAGRGGADTLAAGAGADTVDGGAGDDLIRAGAGAKQIDGGAGSDSLELTLDRAAVSVSGSADDLQLTAPGMALSLTGIETVIFADGAVAVADLLGGGAGGIPGEITGTAGADLLRGTGPAERLSGLGGDDVLLGDGRGLYGTEVSAWVYRLFDTVFGREPGTGGHQGWMAQLTLDRMTPEQVVEGFLASPEFQATYGNTTDAEFVTLLFRNVLGRDPATDGLANWVAQLDAGRSRAEVVQLFSDSPEHKLRTEAAQAAFDVAQDPAAWTDEVYRLYLGVLGREPAAEGLAGWAEALAGGMAFGEAVDRFMASAEFQARYGATSDAEFVTLLYNNVLGRDPAPAGLDGWTGHLAAGMSRAEVVTRFVMSAEFVAGTAADLRSWVQDRGTDDVLTSGPGDDLLSGGMWADVFVFGPGDDGNKTVSDLESWDRVDLSGFGYADVTEALSHVTMQGADAVFADGGVTVVFLDGALDGDMILV